MSDGKPGRGSDQFALRLPDGMRDRIKAAADTNNRSMNAEIVATLERAYPVPKRASDFDKVISQVMADGVTRSIERPDTTVYFSKTEDGRVILDVVDNAEIRDT
ncbi:Arc family DNA-binding protein [Roseicitreum antarcticum]|uniref:Arc-like DNA binding domain-containing protein n=1 Tax=Roseicitreum antarcticum TaxID=564137 RepID=A0A1H2ZWN0_9RHOB|nr:Arc family DNA-binding protein [Roseicitreum antarcticum]SDX21274.1 Arc-like DNA binding domain-containing protein [Roseicitreum antarcticum]